MSSRRALTHPAVLLRRPRRNVLGVAIAATALVTVAAALGALLYPSYRTGVKPLLFAATPAVGALFERKEHLAPRPWCWPGSVFSRSRSHAAEMLLRRGWAVWRSSLTPARRSSPSSRPAQA